MGNRRSVLVVDDDEGALDAISAILAQHFDVEVCISPEFALQRVAQRSFDLICTDFCMPKLNGVELLEAIASVDPRPGHMVITGEREKFLRAVAIDPPERFSFLFKPCRADEVLAMAERLAAGTSEQKRSAS